MTKRGAGTIYKCEGQVRSRRGFLLARCDHELDMHQLNQADILQIRRLANWLSVQKTPISANTLTSQSLYSSIVEISYLSRPVLPETDLHIR
jgi:hypothetical protein